MKVTSLPGFDTRTMSSKKAARMGDEGKAVGCVPPTALLFERLHEKIGSLVATLVCRHPTVFYLNPMSAVFDDVTNCDAGFD